MVVVGVCVDVVLCGSVAGFLLEFLVGRFRVGQIGAEALPDFLARDRELRVGYNSGRSWIWRPMRL